MPMYALTHIDMMFFGVDKFLWGSNMTLLFTGSADRTVKFWDLETFELIGSAGPEVNIYAVGLIIQIMFELSVFCSYFPVSSYKM